jgi:hypothetical protein
MFADSASIARPSPQYFSCFIGYGHISLSVVIVAAVAQHMPSVASRSQETSPVARCLQPAMIAMGRYRQQPRAV